LARWMLCVYICCSSLFFSEVFLCATGCLRVFFGWAAAIGNCGKVAIDCEQWKS
jgi:hypothetical protein